jgi:hypothetical protein
MNLKSLLTLALGGLLFAGCASDDDGVSITSVNPTSGSAGLEVKITGKNFGTTASAVVVKFGPATATVTAVTETEITTSIPDAAPIGATTVSVTIDGETDNIDFTINDPIVGNWLSEGTNVAGLLYAAPFNTRKITANFRADGTYTVVTTDASNANVTLTGTWTTTAGTGNIRNIVVNQSSPTVLTSTGIYRNEAGLLTYEIVQTNPPLTGVTPPTVAGGFGSTMSGALGTLNVQKYVRAVN